MAKSKETFSKKEREKKKMKKRREKAERRQQRKVDALEGKSTETFMYVDEFGNLTPTPPDPTKRIKIKAEDIHVSTPKQGTLIAEDPIRKGTVKFFNEEKGYGFIIDKETNDSIFVHAAGLMDTITGNDRVTFELEMGPKGPNAVAVKLTR